MSRSPAAGATLIEMIVVLALFSFLLGVVVPSLTALPSGSVDADPAATMRAEAVRSGVPVTVDSMVALPDGRVLRRGGRSVR